MVDSLEKVWLKVLETTFFTCWDFWASKREKVDQLNACTSVHRTTQSMLNQVKKRSASKHEYKIALNKTLANWHSLKTYELCNNMCLFKSTQASIPNISASKFIQPKLPVAPSYINYIGGLKTKIKPNQKTNKRRSKFMR